ncbi:MAG TPA: hypothetical protein VFF67_08930 [Thermoplasmata archaeon]|nr:hypothetical protein [Thermoplasmata archaeon]
MGAAGPLASVVMKAPYRKTVDNPTYSIATGGCGNAGLLKSPFWYPATGTAGFAEAAHAKSCKIAGGVNSDNNGYTTFQLAVPLKGVTTGGHFVLANWTMTVSGTESVVTTGACPYPVYAGHYVSSSCYAYALVSIGGYAYLHDMTNGSSVYPNNYWPGMFNYTQEQNSTYCYSGNCYSSNSSNGANGGFSGGTTFTWNFSATGYQSMNASHHYVVVVNFYGSVVANVDESPYGYPTAKASAVLNMGLAGDSWVLNSITIS